MSDFTGAKKIAVLLQRLSHLPIAKRGFNPGCFGVNLGSQIEQPIHILLQTALGQVEAWVREEKCAVDALPAELRTGVTSSQAMGVAGSCTVAWEFLRDTNCGCPRQGQSSGNGAGRGAQTCVFAGVLGLSACKAACACGALL